MSRQRMIRPEFFHDADLAECSPLARLLFIGLWTLADREGRLRDRPKSIKLALLPADECDVDALLDELEAAGSIIRYEFNDQRFIAVPGFTQYQHCHHREPQSELPEPPLNRRFAGKPRAGLGLAPAQPVASTSTSTSKPPYSPPKGDDTFEPFWTAYPRKQKRSVAQRSWKHLSSADRSAATAVAVRMAACVASGTAPEKQYIPLPTTFLNQRQWEDWNGSPPPNWNEAGVRPEQPTEAPEPGFRWACIIDPWTEKKEWQQVEA